ncbi:amidase family protein [Aliiglaciecola sp. 2_MG-2023]|uniref:amidase n=1 Tax=unclassified Aliiglaciecola TaxID=2593648 RepID=UPI0026E3EAED|nr:MULTISPECIES: amidase family protein [unclassified Aliiglaciecola]MDO6710940.1 amidase family protein [Aliiglaciecola sp. 2_MG-2023]MDO6752421.1 amidase family protein [Aliiglaciecola sp. 1_MG-2023]
MLKLTVLPTKFILLSIFVAYLQGCQQHRTSAKEIDLTELTIAQIHQDYKNGEYNSQDLVKTYLKRIAQHNDKINAISVVNNDALMIAAALDKEFIQTGKLRPLHGIPILVKDNINTANLPTTAGSLALVEYIPNQNAFIIQKLVDAGAIVLAKTNMAEWAFSPKHTESSTIGITRNAYNQDYVPAGSSGGTAAAIAANFATVGLGTDTGNSIRGPSSHAALVGLRTTIGLVSRSAIVPLFLRNDVVGPMARTTEDAVRILDVIAGYDEHDPITAHSDGKMPASYLSYLNEDGLSGARIGVLNQLSDDGLDPEILALFQQSLRDLQRLGATIVDPVEIPNFDSLKANQWCAEFQQDVEQFLATYVKSDTLERLEDIIAVGSTSEFAKARLKANLAASGRYGESNVECGSAYSDPLRIAFRQGIEKVMDDLNLDALIYPSWNNKAALISRFEEDYMGDNSQVISPHTGQPAFTVPMGFTSENLPTGLQFLGRMYNEPKLIQLIYAYEQGTKHRKPAELN